MRNTRCVGRATKADTYLYGVADRIMKLLRRYGPAFCCALDPSDGETVTSAEEILASGTATVMGCGGHGAPLGGLHAVRIVTAGGFVKGCHGA